MTTKVCPVCGNVFTVTAKHPNTRFCSHKCVGIHQRRDITLNCLNCGVAFTSKPKEQRQFCSTLCSNQYNHVANPEKQSVFTCEICGKSFEDYASRNRRFCSRKCSNKNAATQPKLNRRKPEIHVIRQCVVCGKDYQTTTHQIRERGSTCCSRECMYEKLSVDRRASRNINYRGGSIKTRGPNWKHQSRKALARDEFRCQVCHKRLNKKPHDFAVHHIIAFRTFNGDYEQANRLSNLVTLCRSCHAKIEFGYLPCPRPLFDDDFS